MSDTENPQVVTRIHGLRARVNHQLQTQTKRQKVYLFAGIFVVVSCFFSLLSVTTSASKLDAQTLTQVARLEVEQQLPSSRENVMEYLQSEAPSLVARLIDSVLDLLPRVRATMVGRVDERITALNTRFEAKLVEEFRRALTASKSDIDRAFPNAPEAEKLQKILEHLTEDFTRAVDVSINEVYPQYALEMNRIQSYLEDLNGKSDAELTEKERLHKEIFQTLLRLMIREQQGR